MTWDIEVIDDQENILATNAIQNTSLSNSFDTIGVLMIPSIDYQEIAEGLRSAGFGIDNVKKKI
ncbi:MAG TPA: hypothetical protein VIP70_12310 [Nitrososphaeraceae archaeon]